MSTLCPFFYHKLTSALLETVEKGKMSLQKNVPGARVELWAYFRSSCAPEQATALLIYYLFSASNVLKICFYIAEMYQFTSKHSIYFSTCSIWE